MSVEFHKHCSLARRRDGVGWRGDESIYNENSAKSATNKNVNDAVKLEEIVDDVLFLL